MTELDKRLEWAEKLSPTFYNRIRLPIITDHEFAEAFTKLPMIKLKQIVEGKAANTYNYQVVDTDYFVRILKLEYTSFQAHALFLKRLAGYKGDDFEW